MSEPSRPESPRPRLAGPTSLVVWGSNRALLARTALALARAAGTELFWFEVRDGNPSGAVEELAELARLDPSHAFGVAPGDVAPDARANRPERGSIVADAPTSADAASLRMLLLMPPRLREVVLDRDPGAPPATLVVSNADRAAEFYSADPGTFADAIRMLNRLGLTLLVTTGRRPRPNVGDFSVVFEVSEAPGGPAAMVVCEAGDPTLGPAFVPGARTLLPAFLDALGPALAPSSQGAP